MRRFTDVRELDPVKAATMALELYDQSSPVVGWYPHIYGDRRAQEMKTVRGPFFRWFALMEGDDRGRDGKKPGLPRTSGERY